MALTPSETVTDHTFENQQLVLSDTTFGLTKLYLEHHSKPEQSDEILENHSNHRTVGLAPVISR